MSTRKSLEPPSGEEEVEASGIAAASLPSARQGQGKDPPPTNLPTYKDQCRSSISAPSPAPPPLADALRVSNSQIASEEKLRLEKEKLELQVELERQRVEVERQRVELERQRSVNQQQQMQHQQQPQQQPLIQPPAANSQQPSSSAGSDGVPLQHYDSKKRWIAISVVVVLLLSVAVTIAGVCGSGNCARSNPSPSVGQSLSPTNPPIATFPPSAPPDSSSFPTLAPQTNSPTTLRPTPAPVAPTGPTPRDRSILTLINGMTLSGQTLRYPSIASAEERALVWLIDDDLGTDASNELALVQRYALATLAFQTSSTILFNGTEFVETWVQRNVQECDWFNVDCDGSGRIDKLVLDNDNVLGNIPPDLGLLTALTELDLRNNSLTGPLPTSLVRLTALKLLDLSENQLTGTIPSSWQAMTALTHLDLAINELTGTIPSLEGLTALTGLILWENQLRGTIPPALGNLTALAEVSFRTNQLTGEVPSALTSLTALRVLALYNNHFTGTMPFCSLEPERNFTALVIDCNEVDCPCCTRCCPTAGWDGIQGIVECDAR